MNSFGSKYCFTSFGESHGAAIGGVVDGCPSGIKIDFDFIHHQLDRRAGRVDNLFPTSVRAKQETDSIEWLSGLYQGVTLGTPIAFIIRNSDARSADYAALADVFRPGHADYTYQAKYGIRDPRGGGRASARETVARVVAGAIAMQILKSKGITIAAEIAQIGGMKNPQEWAPYLEQLSREGDSIGGIVKCRINNVPVGVGEPIADKLSSRLAQYMLSINGCKGFDYGSGFGLVDKTGSELNDCTPESNYAGGMLGGISNGKEIYFRLVFKPTPSIHKVQHIIDSNGCETDLQIAGRHDVCYVPRVLPVVESMAALALIDLM